MSRRMIVQPWKIEQAPVHYDAVVATLGYESRAAHLSRTLPAEAPIRLACGFQQDHIFQYEANRKWFEQAQFEIEEPKEDEFPFWFYSVLERIRKYQTKPKYHVRIDISSLTRYRLAAIIHALRSVEWDEFLAVDFVYSLAEYSAPPAEISVNRHVGPVLPEFSGWWSEPDRPAIAIVGLGYEENKALGAVEHIQASDVWIFTPESPISEYTPTLTSANQTLIEGINQSRLLRYSVNRPFDTFADLESLTSALLLDSNPTLFPFGPKIFALTSLLVACIHPTVAVWRVSGSEAPTDRIPSRYIYGLSVTSIPVREFEPVVSTDALVAS